MCWNLCGMARNAAGLQQALARIPELRDAFWRELRVTGRGEELNQQLEKAGRVADYFELAELMCRDALQRDGVVRRPLPRREPDREGRGAARRRPLQLRRGLGVEGRGRRAGAAQGAAGLRAGAAFAAELRMNLTLRVWRQKSRDDRGRFVEYAANDITPDMSFLEMLDVVNEGLIAQRRGADRLRPRLPRRNLRRLRHDDQRRRARPAARHGHLPAPHAPLPRRGRDHHRALAGAGLSGGPRPDRRPLGLRSRHPGRAASSRSTPARRRRPT